MSNFKNVTANEFYTIMKSFNYGSVMTEVVHTENEDCILYKKDEKVIGKIVYVNDSRCFFAVTENN